MDGGWMVGGWWMDGGWMWMDGGLMDGGWMDGGWMDGGWMGEYVDEWINERGNQGMDYRMMQHPEMGAGVGSRSGWTWAIRRQQAPWERRGW